jgi:hypothetical protein
VWMLYGFGGWGGGVGVGGCCFAAHLLQTLDLKATARKIGCWKKDMGEVMVRKQSEAP